jgi:hypothetical protein
MKLLVLRRAAPELVRDGEVVGDPTGRRQPGERLVDDRQERLTLRSTPFPLCPHDLTDDVVSRPFDADRIRLPSHLPPDLRDRLDLVVDAPGVPDEMRVETSGESLAFTFACDLFSVRAGFLTPRARKGDGARRVEACVQSTQSFSPTVRIRPSRGGHVPGGGRPPA